MNLFHRSGQFSRFVQITKKICKEFDPRPTNVCKQLFSKIIQENEMTDITPEIFESEAMQHIHDLYRTAVRLTRDAAEADDLVQETYMQAWKSFDHYQPGTNCRAWLYKILFNKFDHHRRKKYTQAKYFQEADELVFANSTFTPSVPDHLTDAEVISALNKLPDHYRSVVLLADVHEFDYKEVAQILDIPIGTVMSRLNRARTQLKRTLAHAAAGFGIRAAQAQLAA
jgi:RNA polymerase sigma-70 factor, ECF subfamily